jgi:hypothetical protein
VWEFTHFDPLTEEEWEFGWPESKNMVRDALKSFVMNKGEYPLVSDHYMELMAQDMPPFST